MTNSQLQSLWKGWELLGQFGSGTLGDVYLAKGFLKDKPIYTAVRELILPPEGMSLTGEEIKELERCIRAELEDYRKVKSLHLAPADDLKFIETVDGLRVITRTGVFMPMDEYFEKNVPTRDDVLRLGRDICSALKACEDAGLVHGDVRPGNIMMLDSGDFILCDFGLRRCLKNVDDRLVSPESPVFEPPEGRIDMVSDIYSLGRIMAWIYSKTGEKRADRKLIEIIVRAMSEKSALRYQTAGEMLAELNGPGIREPKAPRKTVAMARAIREIKWEEGQRNSRDISPMVRYNPPGAVEEKKKKRKKTAIIAVCGAIVAILLLLKIYGVV
ncbi:MAG: protein kinase [Oscillospiraceae bacterium]|nr:protein kinase [Oscillospiraceae bacterium]